MNLDDLLGPPVDPRYRRAVARQNAKPPAPPIACTPADLREGPTADELCDACGHPKRAHDFQPDGCEICGCQEWDPMCTAIESNTESGATVTQIGGECPDCDGEGKHNAGWPNPMTEVDCDTCQGSGETL